MKTILFKFPSRERPHKLIAALDDIHEKIGYDNFKILCSLDFDDEKMNSREMRNKLQQYKKLRAVFWKSTSKVDAINRDMEYAENWDIGVLMSDDMKFTQYGFGKTIVDDFEENFPDGDGVLHYPDRHAVDGLITLSILDKKYYDRDGYWYNPMYKSVACDHEFTEVSRIRGRYKFVNKHIYNHEHFCWGHGEADDLMLRNEEPVQYQMDLNTLAERRAINFGL